MTTDRPLEHLHMDLFGSIAYISIGGSKYYMPPLLFKMIFQFCLIASVKLVFVTDIVDWDKGFFAYFLCPPWNG